LSKQKYFVKIRSKRGGNMVKDKDFTLYLDEKSYNRLYLMAESLGMRVQDYVYYKLFSFFLNSQELPEDTDLKGGDKYVHLRIPQKIYSEIRKLAKRKRINLSEVVRRIVSGTKSFSEKELV
jgi:hypothetical protein